MVRVHRILRGQTVPNVLGDNSLTPEQEKSLRRKYMLRAIEMFQAEVVDDPVVWTLDAKL